MKKVLVGTIVGLAAGAAIAGRIANKLVVKKSGKVDKFKGYYNMLNHWLAFKQDEKSLEPFFLNNGYKKIAIYGMGEMGERLYAELKKTSIEVLYTVDKEAGSIYSECKAIGVDGDYDKVDVIIVTAIFAFDDIADMLGNKVDFDIVSLEDVIFDI